MNPYWLLWWADFVNEEQTIHEFRRYNGVARFDQIFNRMCWHLVRIPLRGAMWLHSAHNCTFRENVQIWNCTITSCTPHSHLGWHVWGAPKHIVQFWHIGHDNLWFCNNELSFESLKASTTDVRDPPLRGVLPSAIAFLGRYQFPRTPVPERFFLGQELLICQLNSTSPQKI